jgi:hypothetical protein
VVSGLSFDRVSSSKTPLIEDDLLGDNGNSRVEHMIDLFEKTSPNFGEV